MKKILKFSINFFILSLLILPLISFSQTGEPEKLEVETLGCAVKTSTTAIFEGVYFKNAQKKKVTTYFEYKRGDANLEVDVEKSIEYVPKISSPVYNYFYQTPGTIKPFSIYYFRAVSYFNDDPDNKFYGNILTCNTNLLMVQGSFIEENENPKIDPSTKPDPVLIVHIEPATNVTSNSATFNGFIKTEEDISDFNKSFQYITEEDCKDLPFEDENKIKSIPVEKITGIEIKKANASVSGLEPSSIYCYRLKLEGYDNEMTFSNIMAFKTSASPITIPTNKNTDVVPINTTPTLFGPISSGNESNLIPCGTSTTEECGKLDEYGVSKGWNQLMELINNVVKFILFDLIVPIAAIMFAYAGFELLTAGGETSKMAKAKKIFVNVLIGLVFAIGAWLIVETILTLLGYKGAWIGF